MAIVPLGVPGLFVLQSLVLSLNLLRMSLLPFAQLPSTNNLFLDFVESFDRVAELYPRPDHIRNVNIPHRTELCDVLLRQNESWGNPATQSLLKKLRQSNTGCVIRDNRSAF